MELQTEINAQTPSTILKLRHYITGDESQILSLSKKCFRNPLDLKTWQWKFQSSPYGCHHTLGFKGGELTTHYSSLLHRFHANNEIIPVANPVDSMSHSELRTRYDFLNTCKTHFQEIHEKKCGLFAYGFPGQKHSNIGIENGVYEKYDEIYLLTLHEKKMNVFKKFFNFKNFPTPFFIPPHEIYTQKFIQPLWYDFQKTHSLGLIRDHKYLQWRYFTHPKNKYVYLKFGPKKNPKVFLILSLKENQSMLMDYFYSENNKNYFYQSIKSLVNFLNKEGHPPLTLIQPPDRDFFNFLKLEFLTTIKLQEYNLVLHAPSLEKKYKDLLTQKKLHYTLGDYDCH